MSRQPFNQVWAAGVDGESNENSFQQPSNTRINTGWEGGLDKDPPPAGEENWWHNRVDIALQNLERFGVMTWDALAVYSANAPTRGSDGNFYESAAGSNIGNDPTATTGFWRLLGASLFSPFEPGDLKMVAHNNVPSTGWLKCNGALLTRSSYQRLFDVIGTTWNTGGESVTQFRVPDYRGVFVRAFDDGKGIDAGRVFASEQKGSFHNIGSDPTSDLVSDYAAALGPVAFKAMEMDDCTLSEYPLARASISGAGTSISLPGRNDLSYGVMRPRNKTANYWIKY